MPPARARPFPGLCFPFCKWGQWRFLTTAWSVHASAWVANAVPAPLRPGSGHTSLIVFFPPSSTPRHPDGGQLPLSDKSCGRLSTRERPPCARCVGRSLEEQIWPSLWGPEVLGGPPGHPCVA